MLLLLGELVVVVYLFPFIYFTQQIYIMVNCSFLLVRIFLVLFYMKAGYIQLSCKKYIIPVITTTIELSWIENGWKLRLDLLGRRHAVWHDYQHRTVQVSIHSHTACNVCSMYNSVLLFDCMDVLALFMYAVNMQSSI